MNTRRHPGNVGATLTRHASEFLGGFLVAVAVTVVLGIAFAITVGLNAPPVASADSVLPDAVVPPAALDNAELFGWSLHALFVVLGAIGLGQFVWGNGVRPNSLTPNHPSLYYTLSLPVSRTTLVLSRYLFAAGGAACLMALMLLIDGATLWLFGHPVPLGAMGAASLTGFLFLCVVTAVYGFLGVISDNLAAGFLMLGVIAVAAFAWTPVFGVIAAGSFDFARVAGLLAAAAALVLGTVYFAKRRDF